MIGMKANIYILLLAIGLIPLSSKAQLRQVIVEKYYVSDANDATDTNCVGGYLPAGSTTYRVYIGLQPGFKLTRIYGNGSHTIKIISDSVFFNNNQDGQSFGYLFSKAS